jgi:hypothetical protein
MNAFRFFSPSKPAATPRGSSSVAAVLAVMTLAAASAYATVAPAASTASVRFETGGASYEQVAEMNARANDYSLKLLLASKGSGAYLADVDVQVLALPSRQEVLNTRTEGPLLLAELPPGRYEITARYTDVRPGAATELKRVVTVPRQGLAQAVIYFDAGV